LDHAKVYPVRLIRGLLRRRLVRFALVGGGGIPINMALLWFFHALLHMPIVPAWICAFEPSALLNFYANQRFTYGEQDHLSGWDWPTRALKAQASSLSGQVVNVLVFAGLLKLGVHYLPADALGIVAAFSANFVLANRYVFTPARAAAPREITPLVADFESVA
jgi:dolichol-phosphate mannosyltransferase